jgi:hypothetical protein
LSSAPWLGGAFEPPAAARRRASTVWARDNHCGRVFQPDFQNSGKLFLLFQPAAAPLAGAAVPVRAGGRGDKKRHGPAWQCPFVASGLLRNGDGVAGQEDGSIAEIAMQTQPNGCIRICIDSRLLAGCTIRTVRISCRGHARNPIMPEVSAHSRFHRELVIRRFRRNATMTADIFDHQTLTVRNRVAVREASESVVETSDSAALLGT